MKKPFVKPRTVGFWLFLAACLLQAAVGRAEFYRYVDRNGHRVYVDDISKVPQAYRDQLKVYRERYDHLPEERRQELLEQDRRSGEALRALKEEELKALRRKRQTGKSDETPIVVEGNKILVPAVLGYGSEETKAMLVLDTGASLIALHREVADRLGIREVEKAKLKVVGGGVIDSDIIHLSYVKVGPYTKHGLRAGIIDHQGRRVSHAGLLGMNFLRGLDYSIDFSNSVIRWRKRPTQQ